MGTDGEADGLRAGGRLTMALLTRPPHLPPQTTEPQGRSRLPAISSSPLRRLRAQWPTPDGAVQSPPWLLSCTRRRFPTPTTTTLRRWQARRTANDINNHHKNRKRGVANAAKKAAKKAAKRPA